MLKRMGGYTITVDGKDAGGYYENRRRAADAARCKAREHPDAIVCMVNVTTGLHVQIGANGKVVQ